MAAQRRIFEQQPSGDGVFVDDDVFVQLIRAIYSSPNNNWTLTPEQRKGVPGSLLLAVQYVLKQASSTIEGYEQALDAMERTNMRSLLLNDAITRWSKVDLALFNDSSANIVQIYLKSLNDIRKAFGADIAAFALIDDQRVQHYLTDGFELDTAESTEPSVSVLQGLADMLLVHQATVFNRQQIDVIDLPPGHPQLHKLLVLPIRINGHNIGFIYLGNQSEPQDDDADELHIAEWLSVEISALFERQQLTRQLHREKEEQQRLLEHIRFAQMQLTQAEKMASVARLAAGVAHEVNNPIGYVSSNVVTLKTYINNLLDLVAEYTARQHQFEPADQQQLQQLRARYDVEFIQDDSAHLIEESTQGLLQVSSIVASLESLCAWQQEERERMNINDCVDRVLEQLGEKSAVTIVREFGDVECISAVTSQIEKMLRNVIDNAIRAIDDHGEVRIQTGMQGDDVFINISDNGRGIEDENLSKIFDPFYTSRDIGEGMGLGLSLTYSIVEKHNGAIRVESALGEGTTFYITLRGESCH